jgi:ABC-2 type transport system permease protein
VLATLAFALTGLGFILAWMLDSTQGFHAVMNLLLFPMWLLSGAVFPPTGAAGWIQAIMAINPMTYGVSALRAILSNAGAVDATGVVGPLSVLALFGLLTLAVSGWSVHHRRS